MKIYLASRFSNRFELRKIRDFLTMAGHEITSRWIDVDTRPSDNSEELKKFWMKWAKIALFDLIYSELLILYTMGCDKNPSRGGKRFEEGFAFACNYPIIVVGPKLIVFDYLDTPKYCDKWDECFEILSTIKPKSLLKFKE